MVESKKFLVWHKLEVARYLGKFTPTEDGIDAAVDRLMEDSNLKVETYTP